MRNVAALLEFADYLENNVKPSKFDMDYYVHDANAEACKTVACIAGHKTLFDAVKDSTYHVSREMTYHVEAFAHAKEAFGIDHAQAYNLFLPWDGDESNGWNTVNVGATKGAVKKAAIVTLRRLAATGKIKWSHALTKEELVKLTAIKTELELAAA